MGGRDGSKVLAAGILLLLAMAGAAGAETLPPAGGDAVQQDSVAPQATAENSNVPEPATMILLGGGLGIMFVLKKRDRQQFVRSSGDTSD
ncbi:MAG: PEP-CTERM sorting domain-containing protein [Planctomycetes bacterium]|nr:PEP-CTERM sorting domain-containing protein [Planctomycetota bacterium]